jgi:hypothetical protein
MSKNQEITAYQGFKALSFTLSGFDRRTALRLTNLPVGAPILIMMKIDA